jgi:hypothetical protein
MSFPRRRVRAATLVGTVSTLAVLAAAAPAAALPAFGTAPVSLPGSGGAGPGHQVVIQSVTVGRHAGFDRVVFTARDGIPAVAVKYVPQVVADPSGQPVSLLGAAFLSVSLRNTAWQTSPSPQPTLTPGFPALRQLKGAGEFEAVASYGIGQATKAGFRVFTLTAPNRVVIDLAAPPSAATGNDGTAAGELSTDGTAGGGTAGGAASAGGGTSGGAASDGGTAAGSGGLPGTGFPVLPVALLGAGAALAGGAGLLLHRRAT